MRKFSFLITTYLLTVLIFIIAKVVFMLMNSSGHAFNAGDVLDVVRHGLTLDLSTGLYVLIVPFLATAASVWWSSKWLVRIQEVYFAIVALALALAFIADTSLYPFWGFKLDASCLQYLSTPSEATASVSGSYLAWRLAALIIVTLLIFLGYRSLLRRQFQLICSPNSVNLRTKLTEFGLYVLMIPVIVIGIRGGIDESTTNIGQVYYSQNQFLNHSAVNPVFSFLDSLTHELEDATGYQFMSDEACGDLIADVYTTASTDSDTLLNTTRPDIVIILLESCSEQFAKAMPHLQQLKQEGVWFSQCYANSWRTDRGTVCTLSGYPSFPTLSVMKIPEKSRSLPSIAKTLKQEGYHTSFLYGGDINFTNMRSYLIATGWEQLTWKADYSLREQNSAQWGVRDDITFNTLYRQLTSFPADSLRQEHILAGYSTLSSHEPWDVPVKQYDDEVLNAFYYLDSCLYEFVSKMRQTPQWENLLIVLVADHGINYNGIDEQQPLLRNHIPLLWLGGAVKEPRNITRLCNQTDIAATLLGQLGLPHGEFRFSRDILSKSYNYPTAVHNFSNAQLLIDSTGYLLYDFDAGRPTLSSTTEQERLMRVNQAILQTTANDLINR